MGYAAQAYDQTLKLASVGYDGFEHQLFTACFGFCTERGAIPRTILDSKSLPCRTLSKPKTDRQTGFGAPANLADWPRQGSNPGPNCFEAKRLSRPVSREPTPLITQYPNLVVLCIPCQVVGDVTPTPCAPPSKGRPLAPAEVYPAARGVRRQGVVTVNRPTRPDRDPARLIDRRACALRCTLIWHISSIWFRQSPSQAVVQRDWRLSRLHCGCAESCFGAKPIRVTGLRASPHNIVVVTNNSDLTREQGYPGTAGVWVAQSMGRAAHILTAC